MLVEVFICFLRWFFFFQQSRHHFYSSRATQQTIIYLKIKTQQICQKTVIKKSYMGCSENEKLLKMTSKITLVVPLSVFI